MLGAGRYTELGEELDTLTDTALRIAAIGRISPTAPPFPRLPKHHSGCEDRLSADPDL